MCIFCLTSENVMVYSGSCACRPSIHVECLSAWFETNATCPICRQVYVPRDVYVAVPLPPHPHPHVPAFVPLEDPLYLPQLPQNQPRPGAIARFELANFCCIYCVSLAIIVFIVAAFL